MDKRRSAKRYLLLLPMLAAAVFPGGIRAQDAGKNGTETMARTKMEIITKITPQEAAGNIRPFPEERDKGGEILRETHLYAVKEGDSLRLDRYYRNSGPERYVRDGVSGKPCVIFVFGGAFTHGRRDDPRYSDFFRDLAENGCEVVSIDYRLGLKQPAEQLASSVQAGGKLPGLMDFAGYFIKAVNMAVEDLYDATAFVAEHAGMWNISPEKIVACGSSAGAITVLQGEYFRCNGHPLAARLPEHFRYAGVISFAGAVYNVHGKMKWENTPSPIQLFHGTDDRNVPYGKLGNRIGGIYGSSCIAEALTRLHAPHYFYSIGSADHSVALAPMNDNRTQIYEFLNRLVFQREKIIIDTFCNPADMPDKPEKFGLKEFLKSNFE